jgi:hypothetical protein
MAMAPFTPKDWRDSPDASTPISAAAIKDLETRVARWAADALNLFAAATPDAMFVGAITVDANGAATGATVAWPDGTTGTYAGTVSGTFPGLIDSYTITYGSPIAKTYTQPAVTRDGAGNITNRPAITVA